MFQSVVLKLCLLALVIVATDAAPSQQCRVMPGDAAWPSTQAWNSLNRTLSGRLIKTEPLAAPCHAPQYNAATCSALQQNWPFAQTHFSSSSSVVAPLPLVDTCNPYGEQSTSCTSSGLVAYAVNVSCHSEVAAALSFAQKNNVRVVIKNTGHDLLGKSTGAGALSIWTHYLKKFNFLNYNKSNYRGPAVKIEAGVQAWEVLDQLKARGLRIVTGSCPSIGLAGGYTQGGGHGILSSLYGLAADNVLEWEVVTSAGEHLVATPSSNADLYWALSGGGPGTFAVVMSMTVKAYRDGPISAAQLSWSAEGITADTFWKGIDSYHKHLPSWTGAGGMAAYTILSSFFFLQPLTFPDKDAAYVNKTIAPFLAELDQLKIPYALKVTNFPNYAEHYANYFGPLPYGPYPSAQVQGSRMIPLSIIQRSNPALTSTLRDIVSDGPYQIVGFGLNVSRIPEQDNAVLPAWRDAAIHMEVSSSWNFSIPQTEMIAREDRITQKHIPALTKLAPDSGAYLNEADPHQPNWQKTFYGKNYQRLSAIKRKWDPKSLFYATTAVGADAWQVKTDGRICRA